jgi:hypothetical protein
MIVGDDNDNSDHLITYLGVGGDSRLGTSATI